MQCFGCKDITNTAGNLRNIIAMSCISGPKRTSFLNPYDITNGKLLLYSITFSFAYVVSSCIAGNIFCQLCNDDIFSTIK